MRANKLVRRDDWIDKKIVDALYSRNCCRVRSYIAGYNYMSVLSDAQVEAIITLIGDNKCGDCAYRMAVDVKFAQDFSEDDKRVIISALKWVVIDSRNNQMITNYAGVFGSDDDLERAIISSKDGSVIKYYMHYVRSANKDRLNKILMMM